MTCKEMYEKEFGHGLKIDANVGCPYDYRYLPMHTCDYEEEVSCDDCWDLQVDKNYIKQNKKEDTDMMYDNRTDPKKYDICNEAPCKPDYEAECERMRKELVFLRKERNELENLVKQKDAALLAAMNENAIHKQAEQYMDNKINRLEAIIRTVEVLIDKDILKKVVY